MNNLKRDIEGVLHGLAKKYTIGKTFDPTFEKELTTQIINLIESVTDEIIGENEPEIYGSIY